MSESLDSQIKINLLRESLPIYIKALREASIPAPAIKWVHGKIKNLCKHNKSKNLLDIESKFHNASSSEYRLSILTIEQYNFIIMSFTVLIQKIESTSAVLIEAMRDKGGDSESIQIITEEK